MDGAFGAAEGVLWESEAAAGTPATRIRRYMSVVERFHGVMRVDGPFPDELLIGWMLPDADPRFIERWLSRFSPTQEEAAAHSEVTASQSIAEAEEPFIAEAELRRLFEFEADRGIQLVVEAHADIARLYLRNQDGVELLELYVHPRDEARRCYRRTPGLNVSLTGGGHNSDQMALADQLIDLALQRQA